MVCPMAASLHCRAGITLNEHLRERSESHGGRWRRRLWTGEGLRKSLCQPFSQALEVQYIVQAVQSQHVRSEIRVLQMWRPMVSRIEHDWSAVDDRQSAVLGQRGRRRMKACLATRSSDFGSWERSRGVDGAYAGDDDIMEQRRLDLQSNGMIKDPPPPYKAPNLWAETWGREALPEEGLISERKKRKREAALGGSPCTYIRRTIRAEVEVHQGTVVIFGDVLEEATVVAGGDILVFGKLSGRVHAGKAGDRDAVIAALEMRPSQIGIADRSAGPPEHVQPYPEVASIGPANVIILRPAGRLLSKVTSAEEIEDLRKRTWQRSAPGSPLSAPSRAALFTGLYIFLIGFGALLLPRTFFGLLFTPGTVPPGWIRVMAVLAMVFGVMYLGTALTDTYGGPHLRGARAFYFSTVIARYMLFFLFGFLVAFGAVQPTLIVLGVINFLGALWMQIALQASDP